ncbi:hypothetical protein FE257_006777 [Aspergillus nanangensis]|uniref:NAD(P)-binding protein n=1 Tax=Aspergillus nanangensis TaxID=2582783 RepID=A0AAD4CNS7_ASPNN|nr:hypothetical protein FE257_006777 [Aspergillus nanangensis]
MSPFIAKDKTIFVAGGSKGLGKAVAKLLATKGANIVILARSPGPLATAKQEILQARQTPTQTVDAFSVDLCDSSAVDQFLDSYGILPDTLICTAGGTSTQLGFLVDISPAQIKSCLEGNYYSAVFIVQSCLRRWLEMDKKQQQQQQQSKTQDPSPRKIVLTSSTTAFLGLPGYIAYTPTKTAIRALADTLRQELLLYGPPDQYQVHCCFPGTFITDAFVSEQQIKPELTKELEGTNRPVSELENRYDSADEIARKLVRGLERGRFLVCMDGTTDPPPQLELTSKAVVSGCRVQVREPRGLPTSNARQGNECDTARDKLETASCDSAKSAPRYRYILTEELILIAVVDYENQNNGPKVSKSDQIG